MISLEMTPFVLNMQMQLGTSNCFILPTLGFAISLSRASLFYLRKILLALLVGTSYTTYFRRGWKGLSL